MPHLLVVFRWCTETLNNLVSLTSNVSALLNLTTCGLLYIACLLSTKKLKIVLQQRMLVRIRLNNSAGRLYMLAYTVKTLSKMSQLLDIQVYSPCNGQSNK